MLSRKQKILFALLLPIMLVATLYLYGIDFYTSYIALPEAPLYVKIIASIIALLIYVLLVLVRRSM